jgi:hypothetical protein
MDHRVKQILVAPITVAGGEFARTQGTCITRFEER